MRTMSLSAAASVETRPLRLAEKPRPEPGPSEVLVRVEVCGVCRTDLHVTEGDLLPHRAGVVPGHEIVGRVVAGGPGAHRFPPGARVGVAWLHRACGRCRFCARGAENLCLSPCFTGWDVDGGYAEYVVAAEAFAYGLPDDISARALAPLLCAGIIGYRAFTRANARPGARIGLFGFGGSAHLVLQIARHRGCESYVFSRDARHQDLARALGATWVGGSFDAPPHPLDAAILFAPAGELVPAALKVLDRGATLAVAGIHLSPIPPLDYPLHLFQEKTLQSVTSNTRADGEALLRLGREIPLETHTVPYALEDANQALLDLKQDRIRGAAVLEIWDGAGEPLRPSGTRATWAC
jgi:propanol-preferring alcohol dehydrogenase